MFSRGYSMAEAGDTLVVRWLSPTLPEGGREALLVLLVLMPLLYFWRGRVADIARRRLRLGALSPRALGLLAPALSLLAGAGLWFARPATPVVEWRLTGEGATLWSRNGRAAFQWRDVAAMAFDQKSAGVERPSLIVTTQDGGKAWFILSWLLPEHADKLVRAIDARAPGHLTLPAPEDD